MSQFDAAAGLVGAVAATAAVYVTVRRIQAARPQRPARPFGAPEPMLSRPAPAAPEVRPRPASIVRARRIMPTGRPRTARPGELEGPWELLSLIGTMQWDRALGLIERAGADLPGVAALAEAAALERVRALPDGEARVNLGAWRVLSALAPGNRDYAERVALGLGQLEMRRQILLSRLTRDEDRSEAGTIWLNHPWNPSFDDVRRPIWLYIGYREGERPRLRLRTHWLGDSRISVRGMEVVHDGVTETLTAGAYKIDPDALGWEWRDEPADLYQIEVLRSLVGAGEVRLRYLGDPWACEALLPEEEKRFVGEMIELYDLLRATAVPSLQAQAA